MQKKKNYLLVKFRNAKWYSIDSYKDIEECSLANRENNKIKL